ncbi:MAG: bifunctional aldolase/short-chain dehydrogenase [Nitrospirae bacterium]|nr:bifunctional aldolase/short-chain dehydrogenase [Nitrospirota bacterium]
MLNRWSDNDAAKYVAKYAGICPESVALRVYTSRLIGAETALVMHGGGNTSVKDTVTTLTGERMEAIFVKGSGWDLDSIEPEGLPGLDLAYLRKLRALNALSDEAMVNELRTHLFNASAPTPSVETLLHAFLPHKFIDHSHAEAVLAITNRENGEALARVAFGSRVAIVPYIMPGFALAKAVADIHDKAVSEGRNLEGLVLMKHGLFTFGPDARTSYDRHISLVSMAEDFMLSRTKVCGRHISQRVTDEPTRIARAAAIAPLIRSAIASVGGDGRTVMSSSADRRMIVEYRTGGDEIAFADSGDAGRKAALAGPMTPDHVIRTKPYPLWLELSDWSGEAETAAEIQAAIEKYAADYDEYFETYGPGRGKSGLKKLDPMPRVIFVPGCGMFAAGATRKDAAIAADLASQTVRMKTASLCLGDYEGLPAADLFDMEYWSLEQAKLGKAKPRPLAGKIALVAGGGGPIGTGAARALAADGAVVVVADISEKAREIAAREVGGAVGLHMDVTDEASVGAALDETCRRFGGIDIVVINAGVAHVQPIPGMDMAAFRRVAEVNLFGAMNVFKAASALMIRQRLGGDIVLISSKNVTAPGADFGAYSATKAAAHQLMRVAAMELAGHDIRVNSVLPDAIFGEGENVSGLWKEVGPSRAKSRGMDEKDLPEFYRNRNLLHSPVTGDDVGRAVAFFCRRECPVTGAGLPVDGGVAAAFPR